MPPTKHKLRLALTCAMLLTAALTISCTGFFQNPILTTITIDPPTPSINQAATQQLTATGTYQDGSTSTLTGGTSCSGNTVCWSSSDTTVITITTGGLATGVGQGTATITAASGAITGTTTATVDLSNVTNFEVCEGTFGATSNCGAAITWDATIDVSQNFVAQGTSNGTTVDLTTSATWTVPSTAPDIQCSNSGVSPESCTAETGATNAAVTVTYGTTPLTATINVAVQ
jgi:uncharacterized protein YjdB